MQAMAKQLPPHKPRRLKEDLDENPLNSEEVEGAEGAIYVDCDIY